MSFSNLKKLLNSIKCPICNSQIDTLFKVNNPIYKGFGYSCVVDYKHYAIKIIENYVELNQPKKGIINNWLYYFVKYPQILAYCSQKLVCFPSENIEHIYLLRDKKAVDYNFKALKPFIKELEGK